MKLTGIVFDIKKYSIHDGPGVRTAVHMKGCPLTCWWCHNPESQKMSPDVLFRPEKCIGCGACLSVCPVNAIALRDGMPHIDRALCTGCGACESICPPVAHELCGREMTVDELMEELRRDEIFFRDGGGVTFSGGEPLMQPGFVLEALDMCGQEGYHRAVDTSGFVSAQVILDAVKVTDLFLYDLKHMDPAAHKLYTGVDNAIILENLALIADAGALINIRFPFMPGLNTDDENVHALGKFVSRLNGITAVNILPYHAVARGKHERWDMEYKLPDLLPPTEHQLRHAAKIIESYGLKTHIGG
ncbi:glycyl-radical enzyme activating protein [Synergistaceae bacterium OttesenSCG-928-D05]|nr:glycyl-radical enzyme activating protein [Synergistaceae bacterium OttesenSCG-928-D05]